MKYDDTPICPLHLSAHKFGRAQAEYMKFKWIQVLRLYDELFKAGLSTPNLEEDFETVLSWYWDLTGSDTYNQYFRTYTRSYLPGLGYPDWYYRLGYIEVCRIKLRKDLNK